MKLIAFRKKFFFLELFLFGGKESDFAANSIYENNLHRIARVEVNNPQNFRFAPRTKVRSLQCFKELTYVICQPKKILSELTQMGGYSN